MDVNHLPAAVTVMPYGKARRPFMRYADFADDT